MSYHRRPDGLVKFVNQILGCYWRKYRNTMGRRHRMKMAQPWKNPDFYYNLKCWLREIRIYTVLRLKNKPLCGNRD